MEAPLLAVRVEDLAMELCTSRALEQASLDPAKMFATHVKLNKDRSFSARLAGY